MSDHDPIKQEAIAIEMIIRELAPLKRGARMRVLSYARDWLGESDQEVIDARN